MKRPVTIQSLADRLREVDRVIFETSMTGCELIRNRASIKDVDVQTGFLRHLYGRRDMILFEAKKGGFGENDLYEHLEALAKKAQEE